MVILESTVAIITLFLKYNFKLFLTNRNCHLNGVTTKDYNVYDIKICMSLDLAFPQMSVLIFNLLHIMYTLPICSLLFK